MPTYFNRESREEVRHEDVLDDTAEPHLDDRFAGRNAEGRSEPPSDRESRHSRERFHPDGPGSDRERHRTGERADMDNYRQGFMSPDNEKELYGTETMRRRSHDRVDDNRARMDRREGRFLDEGTEGERHPERLMRGHGPPDSYDQYGTTKVHIHGPSARHPVDEHYPDNLDRFPDRPHHQHLDPSSAVSKTSRSRRKLDTMLRNDSLSSDPSDCVRPPPPKPHKHKKGKKQRQASLSSSEDEIQTTPECTSCDEPEIESESVSEKGNGKCCHPTIYTTHHCLSTRQHLIPILNITASLINSN